MRVDVFFQNRRYTTYGGTIRGLSRVVPERFPRLSGTSVTVALLGDAAVRVLNRRYRRHDRPTDVLSFSEFPSGRRLPPRAFLGQIVVAVPYARRQARRYGHPFRRELQTLLVHGFLHLIGYDHLNTKDEQRMQRLERQLLATLTA
ncbi:MAG: rRNA maturation RNase YbeY [Patescibacteria group bacterium]